MNTLITTIILTNSRGLRFISKISKVGQFFLSLPALSLIFLPLSAQVLDLSLDEYIKGVRDNHPQIEIEEIHPAIKKSMLEEDPIVSGYGGNLFSSYQQNHTEYPYKSESKNLNFGWNYKLLQSGTTFGVKVNNTQTPINDTDYWNTTASLTINQPLLYNGIIGNQINMLDIKRYDYEISQVSFRMTLSGIVLQSLILYRQYQLTKEMNKLSKELLKSAEDILEFNRKRVSIGTVSRSDLLNSESQIIKNQIDIQNSDNGLLSLQESLLYNMGHPEPDNKNITLNLKDSFNITPAAVEYEQAWETAAKERAEFQLYSLQIAAAENAISLGKKSIFPVLDVFLTYSFLGRDTTYGGSYQEAFSGLSMDNTDITWGVNFSISTELAKYKLATQRPNQNKELSQKSLINFQRNLRNDIRSKVRGYNNAYDVYKKNQEVVGLTRRRYDIAKEEYFIGKIDYTRLLQIEQELKQATITYLNSEIDYYRAELELENAQGIMLRKYGVE